MHTHSSTSDGMYSNDELISLALLKNLSLSKTDHNMISDLNECRHFVDLLPCYSALKGFRADYSDIMNQYKGKKESDIAIRDRTLQDVVRGAVYFLNHEGVSFSENAVSKFLKNFSSVSVDSRRLKNFDFIPGVEVSASFDFDKREYECHLLMHFVNPNDDYLKQVELNDFKRVLYRSDLVIKLLKKKGVDISIEQVQKFCNREKIDRKHIKAYLDSRKEYKGKFDIFKGRDFKKSFEDSPNPHPKCSLEDVALNYSGKVAIAHPYSIVDDFNYDSDLLKPIIGYMAGVLGDKLVALELYIYHKIKRFFSKFENSRIVDKSDTLNFNKNIARIASKLGISIIRGDDFHGDSDQSQLGDMRMTKKKVKEYEGICVSKP